MHNVLKLIEYNFGMNIFYVYINLHIEIKIYKLVNLYVNVIRVIFPL